jgi:hypothetical protein
MKTSLTKIGPLSGCGNKSCNTSLTQQCSDQSLSPARRVTGWFFAFLALLACPCHIAIWGMLFSRTALGQLFSEQTATAAMGFSVIFLVSLIASLLAFNKRNRSLDALH